MSLFNLFGKKRFYDRKAGKTMNFFYKCGYCGQEFDLWINEDLKGANAVCPHCKNVANKESYYKKRLF